MSNEIYFNAQGKALESKSIPLHNLYSLANATSIKEVVNLLNENDVLQGIKPKNFKDLFQIINREEKKFITFLLRNSPDENISKFFTLKYDYLNVETLYLENILNKEENKTLIESSITLSTIRKKLKENNYKSFSKELQSCLQYCDNLILNENKNGFLIDTAFKQSYYKELKSYAINTHLKKIYTFTIDSLNIKNAICFRDNNIFQKLKINGGSLKDDFLEMLGKEDYNSILEKTKLSPFYSTIKLIIEELIQKKPLKNFEFLVDCYPISYCDKFKYSDDNCLPYISYCFLKQTELINLRIIFNGLQSKKSSEDICAELRRVYAK